MVNFNVLLKWITIIVIIVSVFVLSIILFQDSTYTKNKENCLNHYNKEIKGVVLQKYIDVEDKHILKYKIKNKNDTIIIDFIIVNEIVDISEILDIGDYYYKPAKSFKNYIHKRDTIIYRQGLSCFCGDSIPEDCKNIIEYTKSWWDKIKE